MTAFAKRFAPLALALIVAGSAAPALAQQTTPPTSAAQAADPPLPETEPHVVTNGTGAVVVDTKIPHELSPLSMFLAADVVVKGVMIGLMGASLATWTVLFGKSVELGIARRRTKLALSRIEGIATVSEARLALGARSGLVSSMLAAATNEVELSGHGAGDAGVKERVESRLVDLVRSETQNVRRGMGLLATIGSTAPFVGLFGTVWGIMNSFIGISKSQTTNLAVVAPGIAEALLATAVGLVAAIPAVIIYNHFSRATRGYQLLISRGSGAVSRLISREIDRTRGGVPVRAKS